MAEVFTYRGSTGFRMYGVFIAVYVLAFLHGLLALFWMKAWPMTVIDAVAFLPVLWIGLQYRDVCVRERIVVEGQSLTYTDQHGRTSQHRLQDLRLTDERPAWIFRCLMRVYESREGTVRVFTKIENYKRLIALLEPRTDDFDRSGKKESP